MNDSPEMRARATLAAHLRATGRTPLAEALEDGVIDHHKLMVGDFLAAFAQSPEQQGEGKLRSLLAADRRERDDIAYYGGPSSAHYHSTQDALLAYVRSLASAPPIPDVQDGGERAGEHRLCPWCGGQAILVQPWPTDVWFRAGCGNDRCEVKPFAKAVSIAQAWGAWDAPPAIPERGEVAIPEGVTRNWASPDLRDLHTDAERLREHDLGNKRHRDLMQGVLDMLVAADVELFNGE